MTLLCSVFIIITNSDFYKLNNQFYFIYCLFGIVDAIKFQIFKKNVQLLD